MARAIDPKAKAKRQKIIAAVGAVILVVLLAWRVPPVIALMNKKPPAQGSTPVTAPTPVAPVPGAPLAPVAPTGAAPSAADLVDTDPIPVAGPGQLVSFGRFVSKDPFVPQAGKRCVDSAGGTIACPPSSSVGSKPKQPIKQREPELDQPSNPAFTSKPAARSSAQISVNGKREGVSVNATFPSDDPVFRLVSVTAKSAKVAIDGGSYASGDATIALKKGQPVTLVNTADGTRYRVVLL
jgi:hypothetical protein